MVVFGQSGSLRKSGLIRARWLYSDKVVVFGQKWLYSGKSGYTRAKGLYSGKMVVFGQKWLY